MNYLISDIPYFQTPNDIFQSKLNSNEKLVYIYLCRCANNGKVAFPSYQTIADNCSISKSSATRSISKLSKDGYIVKQNRSKNNEKQSNLYNVNYDISIVTETIPIVTENTPIVTETHNKELLLNKSLKINNLYLHHSTSDGDIIIKILALFCFEKFGKPLRQHKGVYDLYDLETLETECFYDFLENEITSYAMCNLDYMESIQGRSKNYY